MIGQLVQPLDGSLGHVVVFVARERLECLAIFQLGRRSRGVHPQLPGAGGGELRQCGSRARGLGRGKRNQRVRRTMPGARL